MKYVLLGLAAFVAAKDARIDNVVVLMLENRAFDHMLGFLKRINPDINGLTGTEMNRYNSSDITSKACTVNDNASYKTYPDPNHSVPAVTTQIFGYGPETADPAPMSGFVEQYKENCDIMNSFNATRVPVISQLAQDFALFDAWYCSVPGPTFPNRLYWHSATSYGTSKNDGPLELAILAEGFPQKTVYQAMNESGYSWKGYFDEVPDMLLFKWHRHVSNVEFLKPAEAFYQDAKEGKLPNLSFFSPRYFSAENFPANDQHPDHDVQEAETLMAKVYEAVRKSPQWNSTLLIVTYDEHGGLYDHVSPPSKGIPNPDGRAALDPPFNFERLGVRVPTILVSPWISKRYRDS
jgi:phospholipase C